jgi:hypothetical protein
MSRYIDVAQLLLDAGKHHSILCSITVTSQMTSIGLWLDNEQIITAAENRDVMKSTLELSSGDDAEDILQRTATQVTYISLTECQNDD